MSKSRAREIREIGDRLHSDRGGLMSLFQETAEHFYPERADFTASRALGDEYAAHLMSSYPVLARRTLGDQFGAMLRPRQKQWFKINVLDEQRNDDPEAKRWLEHNSERMRKFMYEKDAGFVRATSEGDHDFATFGNAVIEARMNRDFSKLLFRCHHIKETVWCEDDSGKIEHVDRKFDLTAKAMCDMFGEDKVAPQVKQAKAKEPYRKFPCRHIVMPYDGYEIGGRKRNAERLKFVNLYIDVENDHILDETPRKRLGFIVPRWKTLPGSQYGFSPIMALLPDARLMQQMATSLLEASEKAATPPMIAVEEAIRSDIDLAAGGVTSVDAAYNEKLGEVLRPLTQNIDGLRYGLEMLKDVRETLKEGFYLNRINLPAIGPDMTAFEVQERVKEHIRAVLPLFEPMEADYNGQLCEETFELLLENGAFGGPDDMPDALSGQDIRFTFESPLQATADRTKLEAFKEAAQLTGMAMQLDPGAADELNLPKAFRDALDGAQVPADWLNDPEFVDQLRAHRAQQMKIAKATQMAGAAAGIAETAGSAAANFAGAV